MEESYFGHTIGAWKLAGHFDSLYYALIDGMLDCYIQPSKYPRVVLKRIRSAYAPSFIFENELKPHKH